MSTDLTLLAYSALLSILLGAPPVLSLIIDKGFPFAVGNRDVPFTLSPLGIRANRAHQNLLENLPAFAIVVLIAHVTGTANEATALGAAIFFWGRVAHAVVYIAGIPYVRTGAFAVSIAGLIMILKELF